MDTENIEKSNKETEQSIEQSNPNIDTDFLKEMIRKINFNEIIKSVIDLASERMKTQKEANFENLNSKNINNNVNFNFWKVRFLKEFFVIGILLFAICFLSYIEKIDNCTLGTLLGSIIGYSIGNFSSSDKGH